MTVLYQDQTKHALANFPFTYHTVLKEMTYAIVEIKKAAALGNAADGGITQEQSNAIRTACDEILAGKHDDQFVTCALQGGAGTSMHMNVNEVIATLAHVHPNDQVNKSQSTNDVNPSALKIASYRMVTALEQTIAEAVAVLKAKSEEWADIPKLARTHLQDAIPTTVGAEFGSYAAIIARHGKRLGGVKQSMTELNLGGSAIGNSLNASDTYRNTVYPELAKITGVPVKPLANLMSGTSSQTDFAVLAHVVSALYADLSKIASDIRMLSAGPRGGLAELKLPMLQNGSSIMPGKVNPVSAEMVNQTYYLLNGYAVTIEQCAHGAQLELGVMIPIMADTLITSLRLASEVLEAFTKKCFAVVEVDEERCLEHLQRSTAYATMLSPVLGYDVVSDIVHEAIDNKKTIVDVLKEKQLYTEKVQKLLGQS